MSTAVLMLGFVVFFTLTVVGVGVLVWISARDKEVERVDPYRDQEQVHPPR